jgi:hypothetical protein
MNNKQLSVLMAALLILLTAAARIAGAESGLYNFAPVAALGLFSGAVLKDKRTAFLLALLAQFSGDLYFQLFTPTPGFYGISQFFTYGGLMAATLLGFMFRRIKLFSWAAYTIGASTLFFIVSNFGVWLSGYYGLTWGGLVNTYVAALPFYKNTLIGDFAGSAALFGCFGLLQKTWVQNRQNVMA